MSRVDRQRLRRTVCAELRKVRSYRQALRTPERIRPDERERMSTWILIADETLEALREEKEGRSKAAFLNDLYGITHRPSGSGRYVFAMSVHKYHMSESGLERWRDGGVFIASLLAIQYGMVNLSSEP